LPELPEVETVRRGLERGLIGRRIAGVEVLVPKILRPPFDSPEEFSKNLLNRRVESVGRRGKYLILGLDNGYSLSAHLKMRGQMRVAPPEAFSDEKYLCARMTLDDGCEWRFSDIWTWGELRLVPVGPARASEYIPALANMGPEPLGDQFSPKTFHQAARRGPRRAVKSLLLDQNVVAGVGNIYADESLNRAGIHPERRAGDLSTQEWERLHDRVRDVMGEATELGGTASDNFVNTAGKAGGYVPSVYGRHGEPCGRCGGMLQRTTVSGRGTVYCIGCQPLA
jgi:formamidopyrimidine-DNA glycosylase